MTPITRKVRVPLGELEVADWGSGEPVIFVQTALTADELRPLANELANGYRTILYHRRGYAGSSAVTGPGSIARDAADCRALLAALGIDRAHVVGYSYSAAVALELAADAPECVSSLTVIEPPPVHTPSDGEFRAANNRLLEIRRSQGPDVALNEFLSRVIGPDWRSEIEVHIPGAAAQMQRDVTTFFDTDLPALLAWQFAAEDARRITCAVLHIGGTESGPWFAEVRQLILRWFPDAEDVLIPGADHSLAVTHALPIADALTTFLRRHRIIGS
jgi:pimeloyl-ACP methyl ester carboxylesterase